MPVARAVFGVMRQGRDAVGDQSWIGRSHTDFLGWSRGTLDAFYPALAPPLDGPDARWPGVVHVWCRNREAWYACLVFRPTFSSARLVPMWLLAKIPSGEFRRGMLLEGLVRQMIDAAREVEQGSVGGEVWLSRTDPAPETPAGVEDFRGALAIDRRPSSDAFDFTEGAVLRALQLRLEAEVDALPTDVPPRIWAVLRPSGGRLPESSHGTRFLDLPLGISKLPITPVVIRGVHDAAILQGTQPHRVLADAVIARSRQRASLLESHVRVPLQLLSRDMLRDGEISAWCALIARDPARIDRELSGLTRGGVACVASSSRVVAALLCRMPAAISGDLHATRECLERLGIAALLAKSTATDDRSDRSRGT